MPVVLLNVVGLTQDLLPHAPKLAAIGEAVPMKGPLPAVTSTAQATMLTGKGPSDHGVVGNGWLHRETMEVRFWQQSNRLIQSETLYGNGKKTCAKMFWWFNQGAPVDWHATPKPHYGADGSKVFGIIDRTGCELERHLGAFPFFSFWGPGAGLPSSDWIARASARVLREKKPDVTLVYLPHLDYDYQRFGPGNPDRVREVDDAAGHVLEAASDTGTKVVVVSEYGLVPVSHPVFLNRELRKAGWLEARRGPFGEQLDTFASRAFAVADHQLAHVYVRDLPTDEVKSRLESVEGVDQVVAPGEIGLDHPRSGELVALARTDSWFAYPWWFDDARAPDFARTVDIHRKPGYDPCELFMTSRFRAMRKVLRKKLGFRSLIDVIPLDATLVKGSHGRGTAPALCIAEDPVSDMREIRGLVESLA